MIAAMRRWGLLILTLVAITLIAFGVRSVLENRAQKKREIAYETALRSYSAALRPGMTRKDVEAYLTARNQKFRLMCCVETKKFATGVYDELTKIGQEDAPWFCSEKNVYIAFEFAGPQRNPPEAAPSDTLSKITIYPWLEGCL